MIAAAPIQLLGTTFQNPILLAAGTAGFGRELHDIVHLDRLGGIVTKSVSPDPRAGHPPPRVAEFAGGMLNSIGLANPGMEVVAERELPWLAAHLRHARVLVSVVGHTVDDYVTVVRRLGSDAVVVAFELNLSCPNTDRGGEHFGANEAVLADLVRRCAAASAKPVIAKLAPTLGDIGRTATVAADAGAAAITVINTIPGALYDRSAGPPVRRVDRPTARPPDRPTASLGGGAGGVSGPALLAVGLLATRRVREATGLPVIGVGGVRTSQDVGQYLEAGAALVAVGTGGFLDPRIPERLAADWPRSG